MILKILGILAIVYMCVSIDYLRNKNMMQVNSDKALINLAIFSGITAIITLFY